MKKVFVCLFCVIVMCISFGCSGKNAVLDDPPQASGGTAAKDKYVFATLLSELDYFEDYKRALSVAEKELDVDTEFVGPEDYDLAALIQHLEEAIDSPDTTGIILLGWEDALIPVINKASEKGIYVFTITQDLPNSKRNLFISQLNYEAGQEAARILVNTMGLKGDVAILRGVTLSNVTERIRGFKNILDQYPDIRIVADIDNKNDALIAEKKAEGIFQQHPQLKGFLCADGISGPAVIKAMQVVKAPDGICLVTYDRDETVLKAVDSGIVTATLVAQTPLEIYLAIQEGQRMKSSDLQLSYDDKAAGIAFSPNLIGTRCIVVNKSNVKYFMRNYKAQGK